ncbi:tetratricopeptide repeat protein [Robiginitalea sp. IMCC43444]|uniref:tetratricopeptide repeat protein n=1 Tax=Robiginitalea sp. IMCC43444 TaxID=3459121 RepID=UPI0040433FAC
MNKLIKELKRRNVLKETIAYLVVAWLVLQVFSTVLPIWNAPAWILQIITITLGLGLPLWIIFSWHYQITSSGIKKTEKLVGDTRRSGSNRVLNTVIMIALLATIALIWIKPGAVTSVSPDKLSIAVLPFTNMSDDQENEWFSVGVTEDILTHLSKVKGLRVISRTSVMQFRNTDKSIPQIAKELDVAYIVEGSVRKQDNQVLITAQLIKANDEHLWADNYNENLIDAFKIQQEVSQKIVKQLKIFISPEEEKALNSETTTNVMAVELFSKGRNIADNRAQDNLENSIELFKEAIKLDPLFAEGYAEIANSYMLLYLYGDLSKEESAKQANEYIDKALEIDPDISRPYTVRAMLNIRDGDWQKARTNFEKAIELNPNDATAHHHFAIYWRDRPQHDAQKLLKHITVAQKLDPLSRPVNQTRLEALLVNDQIQEAKTHLEKIKFLLNPMEIIRIEGLINSAIKKDLKELIYTYERALEEDPDNLSLLHSLNQLYTWILVDRKKSLEYSKRIFEIDPTNPGYILDKLNYFYIHKQFEEAHKILNDTALTGLLNPFQKIIVFHDYYAFQGNYEKAQEYLEQLKPLNLIGYYSNKAWLYSKKGDSKTTHEVFKRPEYKPMDYFKVICFAHLKETDSLFHYLNKISNYAKLDLRDYSLAEINGSPSIDPYRNDTRYIEIMKAHNFPIKAKPN